MANEETKNTKESFKVLSPAQGPAKIEEKPMQTHPTHVNAKGQTKKAEAKAIDPVLLGTSALSPTAGTEDETISDFVGRHAIAQAAGDMWLETSANILTAITRGDGWKKVGYECYKGVKVCPFGDIDKIEERESKTVHDRMHPGTETTVLSG